MSLPDASRGAPSLESGDAGGTFFASVGVKLGSLQPEAVLAAPAGGVRGFWQSGPHWIAHAGVAAEIDAREWDSDADDRFAAVKERARRLFEAPWVRDLDGVAGRPRLHGGFAFHAGAALEPEPGFWEAFPAARFVLPAFEVEADERGARLTVTQRFPASTPGDRAIDELRRRADRTREQLSELDGSGAAPGPTPRATALESPVGPEVWRQGIERILDAIARGEVRKVVLARPLDVTLTEPPDSAGVL
ncbi:MAG: hypothetical protein R3266_14665, partial [Gemmatimonadota bacterium]|nr:hypothetical protein [Gemmatimonadota bacterium]